MEIQTYMYWAVSIAATLLTVGLVIGVVASIIIVKRLQRIFDKIEAVTVTGLETSKIVQSFVQNATTSISAFVQTFLTLKGAKEVAGHIGDAIAHARGKDKHGK